MKITQLLPVNPDTPLQGRKNAYEVKRWINNPDDSTPTPGYTPTTLMPRLSESKPQIYEAIDRVTRERVTIKAVHEADYTRLLNEVVALKRTRRLPLPIGPRLIEGPLSVKLHNTTIVCVVYEWLDDKQWFSLREYIHDHGVLQETELKMLRKSMQKMVRRLHGLGIIHGDLKDEHVMLHRNERSRAVEFNQIRLIDFGHSYISPRRLERHNPGAYQAWMGGSIGFSNPYFWKHSNRFALSRKELESIDSYGVNTILFYAATKECFPAASPAYRLITDWRRNKVREHFRGLQRALLARWGQESHELRRVIERLTNDPFFKDSEHTPLPNTFARMTTGVLAQPFLALLGFLLLTGVASAVLQRNLIILFSLAGMAVLLTSIFIPPGQERKPALALQLFKSAAAVGVTASLAYFHWTAHPEMGRWLWQLLIYYAFLIAWVAFDNRFRELDRAIIAVVFMSPFAFKGPATFLTPFILGALLGRKPRPWLGLLPLVSLWAFSVLASSSLPVSFAWEPFMEGGDYVSGALFLVITWSIAGVLATGIADVKLSRDRRTFYALLALLSSFGLAMLFGLLGGFTVTTLGLLESLGPLVVIAIAAMFVNIGIKYG
jgi:hypothetical protein